VRLAITPTNPHHTVNWSTRSLFQDAIVLLRKVDLTAALRADSCYPLRVCIDCYIRGAGGPDNAEPGLLCDLHARAVGDPVEMIAGMLAIRHFLTISEVIHPVLTATVRGKSTEFCNP